MSNERKLFYKGVRVNMFGIPIFSHGQRNRVKIKSRKKSFYNKAFLFSITHKPKNLIVMYDIPDSMKKERDWFRRQLIKFDFEMIQRSVWVGPAPLPREFLEYLKFLKIEGKFKTFKLAKPYSRHISAIA